MSPKSEKNPKQTSQSRPVPGADLDGTSVKASPAVVAAILGSFIIISAFVLWLSLPGYLVQWHTSKAEAAISERRFAQAIPHLLFVTGKFPLAWSRLAQLGDCYLELEPPQPQQALDAYTQCLKAYGQSPNGVDKPDLAAKLGRTHYLLGAGHEDEARKLLASAIKANPNDPYANFYIGLLYLQQKSYGRAAFFLQGATSDPVLAAKCQPLVEQIRREMLGS